MTSFTVSLAGEGGGLTFATPEELYFIVEYGHLENAAQLRLYLSEHGSVVCAEDAVERLGVIA